MSNAEKNPLRIKDLTIGKMPGFRDGMKPFEEFSEGINIIAGPNASGKSTTAHAIQKLIWQHDTDRLKIGGHAVLNGDTWTLRVDSGQKISQRDGLPEKIMGLPAAEAQNRYMLALHTLLTADGKDLAKQIRLESVGGYDPEKAADNLGYSPRVSTTGIGTYKEYKSTEDAVRDAQNKQKAVKAEEQKLSELYQKRENAEESDRLAQFYTIAIDTKKAAIKHAEYKSELGTFPAALEHAHGEEFARAEELETEIADAQERIESAKQTIQQSEDQLNELSIPESGVPAEVLDELEERVDRLENAERELASLENEEKGLQEKYSIALKRMGGDADPESLRNVNLEDVGDLDRFLEEAHSLASDKRILEQEIEEFESEKNTDIADSDKIREGVSLLSYWLKEASHQKPFPSWVLITIAALAVLSGVLGYMIPVAGAAGLALILALAVYGWMQAGKARGDQAEQTRINDFRSTGLATPEAWDPNQVSIRLDELVAGLRESRWQEKLSQNVESARKRLGVVESRIAEIDKRRNELQERLTVLPKLPFEHPESYSELASYLSTVRAWQDIDVDLKAQKQKVAQMSDMLTDERGSVSNLIKPYLDKDPVDAAKAKAIYRELKRQEDQRSGAVAEIDRQRSAIDTATSTIDKKREDLTSIYQKFGLKVGEKEKLRHLMSQIEPYQEVKKKYELAQGEHERFRRSLEQHSLYEDEQTKLEEMALDRAQAHLHELQEQAKTLEPLRNEIAEIEANIKSVKSGNSLERALSDRDKAVENLRNQYEENLRSMTGRLLADTIKEEMREQNRPKVFKEANRLFNRITKGRYELRLEENEDAAFRAYDTVARVGRSLSELSSGTRIQLLMAVRLAFVETQEISVKLPILADELLANSDDVRAEAIIQALTEISRDGRQVFYFTAQGDEVAKWESYLTQNGNVDHKVYYLSGETADKTTANHLSEKEPLRLIRDVPEPGLMDHKQYGQALNVPQFNLLIDDPGGLHLWYMMDEPKTLYKAMSSGIDYWGQLKSYLDAGGVIEGLREQQIQEMKEKAELLERYLQLYRQGRPKPIDRDVLVDSGAVSDSFIDAVSKKNQELDGNPEKLLQALRNSEVSGFRTNKIEELEAFLFEHGYLDERETLNQQDLTVALQAFLSKLNLTMEDAERYLGRFG